MRLRSQVVYVAAAWVATVDFSNSLSLFPTKQQQQLHVTQVNDDAKKRWLATNAQKQKQKQQPLATQRRDVSPIAKPFAFLLSCIFAASILVATPHIALAASSTTNTYDGFAEYAQDNKMEQSDVSCFINKCGTQTRELFRNPRGVKGVACLGRCKGEQSCATRCFAEYGSEALNDWLSCTIEENACVKVPMNADNSAEEAGYASTVAKFDPSTLIGTWWKTDGLNRKYCHCGRGNRCRLILLLSVFLTITTTYNLLYNFLTSHMSITFSANYDLFDCQTNTFEATANTPDNNKGQQQLDMGIFFRVKRPTESGGGYWENSLNEQMIVDDTATARNKNINPTQSTMQTSGKMYGLKFSENWYILGESDGSKGIPPFKLVAYKGHTLQGNYEGAFVYAKEPVLPQAAVSAVREAARNAGLDFDAFTRIDNTCPVGDSLNDANAGTGTSATDWVDLVIGQGGIIDWIKPGWRGEYKTKS
jgi:hypothetical protein